MKKNLSVLILLFVSVIFSGQNIDSLKKAVNTTNIEDKLNALISTGNYYFYSNPDSALSYMHKALQIAKDNKFTKKEIYLLKNLGIFYNESGELIKAEKRLSEALKLAEQTSDTINIVSIYGNLGNNYMLRNKFDEALEYFTKTVSLFEKIGNKKGIAMSYGAIGNMYNRLNKNEKTLKYYELAKQKFEEINDTISSGILLMNSGIVLNRINKLEKAEKYFKKAYEIFNKKNIMLNAGKCLQNLANLYLKQNKMNLSIQYSNKAFKIFKEQNSIQDISGTLRTLGNSYSKTKKYKKAVYFLKEAYKIDSVNKDYLALEQVAFSLQEVYLETKNYKNAHYYLLKHSIFHDSVFNAKTTDKFSELEIKYETSQKEQKIKILEKDRQISEAQNQRNMWFIIGFIILFILSATIYLLAQNRKKLKAKQKEIETEQKLLRLQMNPHFIFNAIFAIQNFIYENDTEKSSLYLSNFAKLMRLILNSSRKNLITIEDEVKMLEYYIQFQQLRRENSFQYKIDISDNIDIENTLIPPMLVQPFIENAVEHGFEDNIKNPFLKINLNLKNNYIFVSIEDNGKGINKTLKSDSKNKHQSLATKITEERLSIILKNKNKNIEIIDLQTIDSTKTGTRISFKIPFIEEF